MLRSLAKKAVGAVAPRLSKRWVGRALPIMKVLAIAELALLARRHVQLLGPDDRRRFASLVKRGRSLDEAEKAELRALTARVEPRAFAGSVVDQLSPVPLPKRLTRPSKR